MNLTPVDPDQIPTLIDVSSARGYQMPESPHVIGGLIPVGMVVVYGPPKCGKTTLVAGWENWLSLGLDLGGTAGDDGGRVFVVDMENTPQLTVDISWRYASPGTLPGDGPGRPMENPDGPYVVDTRFDKRHDCADFWDRLTALRGVLADARDRGIPFRWVRVDTLGRFIGSPPQGMNAYEWSASTCGKLNDLAHEFAVALIAIHHVNKAKEISGSTGISGSATVIYRMKTKPGEREGVLYCDGNRAGPATNWPLVCTNRGTWEVSDTLTPVQVQNHGQRRVVVDFLTKAGRATAAEIAEGTGISRVSVKTVLQRLHTAGMIHYDSETRWSLLDPATGEVPVAVTPTPPREDVKADISPRVVSLCEVCGEAMDVLEAGQASHPGCEPDPEQGDSVPATFNAYHAMETTLGESRLHPLWFIPEDERTSGAWPAAVEASWAAQHGHEWTRPDVEGFGGARTVLPLDRHQSYPGACNGVAVAPSKLQRHGALDANPRELKLAGICRVVIPSWEHEALIGNPLGRDAVPGHSLWVPSGQVEQLWKLHESGVIDKPKVVDSWMGRRTTSLFDGFQVAVRDARAAAKTKDETQAIKLHSSIVIRKLHPRGSKSQWWRPDWHAAICAEAATRLWVFAWRAVQAGAECVAMGNTDAVWWMVPEGETERWAPPGYILDDGPGAYHWGSIQVRKDARDVLLRDVADGRVSESPDPKKLKVTGPIPLYTWLGRA